MTMDSVAASKSLHVTTDNGWKGVINWISVTNRSSTLNDAGKAKAYNDDDSLSSTTRTTNTRLTMNTASSSASTISSSTGEEEAFSSSSHTNNGTTTKTTPIATDAIPSLDEIQLYYMGGETSKFDSIVEMEGVQSILSSLSPNEREMIQKNDKTIPIRHLRADKCDVTKAVAQIHKTLAWRQEFGVDIITTCFEVANTEHDTKEHATMRNILMKENETGKIYTRGYDCDGRALFYMTPARENTNNEMNNMRHLVWNLEKAIACTARQSLLVMNDKDNTDDASISKHHQPLEKINLVIDYDAFKLSNAPPMSTTKYTLEILQKHYPERMRHAYLLHPPFIFRTFWALIKNFVDPITKEKIVFCSGPDGKYKLLNNVTHHDKLEIRSYGTDPNIRQFNSIEFVWLPFNVSFDE